MNSTTMFGSFDISHSADKLSDLDWAYGYYACGFYPGMNHSVATGIVRRHAIVKLREITDGASNTYLAGEKWANSDHYTDGTQVEDHETWDTSYTLDNIRWSGIPMGWTTSSNSQGFGGHCTVAEGPDGIADPYGLFAAPARQQCGIWNERERRLVAGHGHGDVGLRQRPRRQLQYGLLRRLGPCDLLHDRSETHHRLGTSPTACRLTRGCSSSPPYSDAVGNETILGLVLFPAAWSIRWRHAWPTSASNACLGDRRLRRPLQGTVPFLLTQKSGYPPTRGSTTSASSIRNAAGPR